MHRDVHLGASKRRRHSGPDPLASSSHQRTLMRELNHVGRLVIRTGARYSRVALKRSPFDVLYP
jgi:hypothetical protein